MSDHWPVTRQPWFRWRRWVRWLPRVRRRVLAAHPTPWWAGVVIAGIAGCWIAAIAVWGQP